LSNMLENDVRSAVAGDATALKSIVLAIQDNIYNLALRMLWHPQDAQDATQEILIRIITHLSEFEHRSAFSTWTYRIAANYLLTVRKGRAEREQSSFELFADELNQEIPDDSTRPDIQTENAELVHEIKVGCTHAMLLCLDRDHRIAYIMGTIFNIRSSDAQIILDIKPAAYRKRLSRARFQIGGFMRDQCGLADSKNSCRCEKRITIAIRNGRLDPDNLLFTGKRIPEITEMVAPYLAEMEALDHASALLRSNPKFSAPNQIMAGIQQLLQSGNFKILKN